MQKQKISIQLKPKEPKISPLKLTIKPISKKEAQKNSDSETHASTVEAEVEVEFPQPERLDEDTSFDDMSHFSLTKELMKRNKTVCGSKLHKYNTLRRLYSIEPLIRESHTPLHQKTRSYYLQIIKRFILQARLKIMGSWHKRNECQNEDDLTVGTLIPNIHHVFIFCLEDNDMWYGFDIRTLNMHYISRGMKKDKFTNPYTRNVISDKFISNFKQKIHFLEKHQFPTTHVADLSSMSEEQKRTWKVVDLFQKLHHLDFTIDSQWFMDLSIDELKKLYYNVGDVWTYRLTIPMDQRKKIVKHGIVFAEYNAVQKINDYDIVFNKVVKNLEKIITEGQTIEDRKLGANYFMIGFVGVSEKVAEAVPHLAEASL